jgi:signal transduction histidine kinase
VAEIADIGNEWSAHAKTNGLEMRKEAIVKILLVDDRPENLLSLEVLLSTHAYQVFKANSGREALKTLLREPDLALILMDVQMPLMDGFETAELIRQNEKFRFIPIIFLTATSDTPENVHKGYQAGAVDYLLKPIVPEILKAKVSVFADLYKKNFDLQAKTQELVLLNKEMMLRTEELIRVNNELEKFAYVASHDMQEPLRTITSYIQLLQSKLNGKLDSEATEFMDFVTSASLRMRKIIVDLLEYSRIGRSERPFEEVNCRKVLDEVLANLKKSIDDNAAQIEIDEMPVIQANYMQMVQLFQNLLGNAIKFKSNRSLCIKVSAREFQEHFEFSIEDNGIGIQQIYEDRIFEIFQRLHTIDKYSGTGIGLAICKKITERHDGRIWMTSTIDQGSVFYFTIRKRPPLSIPSIN